MALATLVIALDQAAALIPAPVPVVAAPAVISPDDKLRAFVRDNAVFFSNGTDYVSETHAVQILDTAAELIKAASPLVRVVGYTDERGDSARNMALAQNRALKIVDELVRRGVDRNRLVSVGRPEGYYLSPSAGGGSPNRRVQFELGFRGEVRQQP